MEISLGDFDAGATEAHARGGARLPPLAPEDLLTDDQDPATPYLRQVRPHLLPEAVFRVHALGFRCPLEAPGPVDAPRSGSEPRSMP